MAQGNNKESKITAQQINMPKGGGAISSLGESFQPNAFSGTGSFSIPLPTSAARGLEPDLSLSYSSGSGNGAFGLGFDLNLSKISIKTEQGLPQYNDNDVYLLDGSELVKNQLHSSGDYIITEYLPRVVGSFITIKHHRLQVVDPNQVPVYWSVIDNDGTTHIYGKSTQAQVKSATDPKHPGETNSRIFEWLIESTEDVKGNKITYAYKQEDSSGAENYIFEQNSDGSVRAGSNTQQYIKKVSWGNYIIDEQEEYAYQLVFDYGEHQIDGLTEGGTNPYIEEQAWEYRPDAFSAYKSRFEIRTRRRCKNILLFHNFPDELGEISLIKALSLNYTQTDLSNLSIVDSIAVTGYRREGLLATGSYTELAMPQIDLSFSKFLPPENPGYTKLTATDNTIPGYLNNAGFLPIDLNREGIAGLLYESNNGLMYLEPKLDSPKVISNDITLSEGREGLSATSVSNYAIFAGGNDVDGFSNRVDIFDLSDGANPKLIATDITLSEGRENLSATSVGNYAIFAGGNDVDGFSNRVDIFDLSDGANPKHVATDITLSEGRENLSATSVGNYAIFAGGNDVDGFSNRVDIFDLSDGANPKHVATNTILSTARGTLSATNVGNYAIFAGGNDVDGFSNRVDIFDLSDGANPKHITTNITLSEGRENLSATSVGNYAIFAGGNDVDGFSNSIDIVDLSDGANPKHVATNTILSTARGTLSATNVGNYAIFAGGNDSNGVSNRVDIFDLSDGANPKHITTNITLSEGRSGLSATSVGNYAIFAGGNDNGPSDKLDIIYLPNGEIKYSSLETVKSFPVDRNFRNNNISLSDLEGNGHLELIVQDGMRKGFYPQLDNTDTTDGSDNNKLWGNYQPFPAYPTDSAAPYMENADLSSNGKTDMFFFNIGTNSDGTERRVFTVIYPSIGKDGYQRSHEVPSRDEVKSLPNDFPLIKRGYKQESVTFANIIGDGMPHRLKVSKNYETTQLNIEYWPSLGYGYFGDKITLDTSNITSVDSNFLTHFDTSRLFFADIDGSGTIDLIYAYANHVDVYINQNGNVFAEPISIELPVHYSNIDQISFADILGNGTSCMVITKISPKVEHYYYNFVGNNQGSNPTMKPYLLTQINNNLGGVTELNYSSSTKFYLEDKQKGRKWITTLPFPVQLVESVTHTNLITNSHFTSTYAYHDGYYDSVERKFRGFAFVERWDSEKYTDYVDNSSVGTHFYQTLDDKYYVPPTYTKTWYHTGLKLDEDNLKFFKQQYYQGDSNSYDFPNDYLDDPIEATGGLTQEQAYTALQGKEMRTELYFDDAATNPDLADIPITVSESNLEVQLYQELVVDGNFAAFMVLARESISYHYERNPQDPRVEQSFVLESDAYGNTLLACNVNLGRRSQTDPNITVYTEQQDATATISLSSYVTPLGNNQYCHVGCESKSIELVNFTQSDFEVSDTQQYIDLDKIKTAINALELGNPENIVPYGQSIATDAGLKGRMLAWHRSYFWNDAQTDYLPLQQITRQALIHHQEEAVFTNDNLKEAFGDRLIANNMTVSGTNLSENRSYPVSATVGNCAMFAGGTTSTGTSEVVDIFDFSNWDGTSTGDIKNVTTIFPGYVGTPNDPRTAMAATTLTNEFGDWALFVGGINGTTESILCDAFDFAQYSGTAASITRRILAMSTTLSSLAATTIENYAIFAGGNHNGSPSSVVNTFDMSKYKPVGGSIARRSHALSEARYNLAATKVITNVNNNIKKCAIFAGGHSLSDFSDRVDIFDLSSWGGASTIIPTTMSLSIPREKLIAANIGNYAIFAGGTDSNGESNVIDLFDFSAYDGSIASISQYTLELSIGLSDLAGTTIGNHLILGGGTSNGELSKIVNVFDLTDYDGTEASSKRYISSLSEARSGLATTNMGNYAIFAGGESATGLSNTVDLISPSASISPILQNNSGYIWDEASGYWWNKGLTQYYYAGNDQFHLPYKTNNAFVDSSSSLYTESTATYDSYYLHTVKTSSYLDPATTIETSVVIDYITGGVKRSIDANNNISEFLFDPLGQVIVTTHYGMQTDSAGVKIAVGGMKLYADSADEPDIYDLLAKPTFDQLLADPTKYLQGALGYYYYNLYAWQESGQPASSITLVRKDYYTVKPAIDESDCQIGVIYSDGFGQTLETKHKVDPGMSFIRQEDGNLTADTAGDTIEEYSEERWRTSGRTVFNNKNLPVEQYLPYYINSPYYEDQADVPTPPPTVTYYDPLGRVIKAVTPKGFFSKVEFTPWETKHFDDNDTVVDSDYVQENYASLDGYKKFAIDKAIKHYNTPSTVISDNRGATFLTVTNNLGNVTAQLFEDNAIDLSISEQIYDYLLNAGYLTTPEDKTYGNVTQTFTFLTGKFQPYITGFSFENLPVEIAAYNEQMIEILKQNCLTESHELDIQGRNTVSTDPRLYYQNITADKDYYNFKYLYPMNSGHKDKNGNVQHTPFYSDSVDAGIEKHLVNIYGQNIFSLTARDYCQITEYDNLQRPIATYVKQITTPGVISHYNDFDLVSKVAYGEKPNDMPGGDPKNRNLYGQAYKLNDLSGITLSGGYDITGKAISTSKQLVAAYQDQIKWNDEASVALQGEIYSHSYKYNALDQLLEETTPDQSVTNRIYNREGSLLSISVTYKGDTNDIRPIINSVEYDSNNQRSKVTYANGVITDYAYETTTLRLTHLTSTKVADNSLVQKIDYYYDPVGNITNIWDNSAETVFNNNQQINPHSAYSYDALYRLIQSSGRVHPALTKGNTEGDKDSFKNTQFISTTNNSQQLENYTESYTYDDAGNFIKKQHSANTNSWTTHTEVAEASNRLADLTGANQYDANGNALSLSIGNVTALTYNWKNELQKATVIDRTTPDDDDPYDDAEYYVYDNGGMRTRRITQRLVSSTQNIINLDDKIYLGNYEVKKKFSVINEKPVEYEQYFERTTLRIMDGDTCVVTIYDWIQDDRQQEVDSVPTVKMQYQLGNHLGSVSMELSDSSQLISYEEYFAYGGSAFMAGSSQKEVKVKEYRYSGKERDDTTGLYYYGARYYAPWLGRWMTTDPAKRVDGMGLYTFVMGNPIIMVDIEGHAGQKRALRRRSTSTSSASSSSSSSSSGAAAPPNKKQTAPQQRMASQTAIATSKATPPNTPNTPNVQPISLPPAAAVSYTASYKIPSQASVVTKLPLYTTTISSTPANTIPTSVTGIVYPTFTSSPKDKSYYGGGPPDPSNQYPGFNDAKSNYPKNHIIAGHAINMEVGGPGTKNNMLILSAQGNSAHKKFDEPMKKAIEAAADLYDDMRYSPAFPIYYQKDARLNFSITTKSLNSPWLNFTDAHYFFSSSITIKGLDTAHGVINAITDSGKKQSAMKKLTTIIEQTNKANQAGRIIHNPPPKVN